MLKKQRVVADRCPVGLTQEPIPELALDGDLRVRSQGVPQLLEAYATAAKGQALAAELAAENERIRGQLVTIGERRLEPGKQGFRVIGLDVQPANLDQHTVAQLERDEARPIGCDAEVPSASLTLPLGQIVG